MSECALGAILAAASLEVLALGSFEVLLVLRSAGVVIACVLLVVLIASLSSLISASGVCLMRVASSSGVVSTMVSAVVLISTSCVVRVLMVI